MDTDTSRDNSPGAGDRSEGKACPITQLKDLTLCLLDSERHRARRGIADALREGEVGRRSFDLRSLSLQCRTPTQGLTDSDYQAAANALGVDVAKIRAVAQVEARGRPFDESGRPSTLFERHIFRRLTEGMHDKTDPDLSKSKPGGYGPARGQYARLERAAILNEEAALQSASWGRFQVMGHNFKAAGFASASEMVAAMSEAEVEHLKAFVNFVKADPKMLDALKKGEWAQFARRYNGPDYKVNRYDTKIEAAYNELRQMAVVPDTNGDLP